MTKATRELRTLPRTILKRVYKNFEKEIFKGDVREAKEMGSFQNVLSSVDENDTFSKFCESFVPILNKHAPLKVIQYRTHYVPYLNEDLTSLNDVEKCSQIQSY